MSKPGTRGTIASRFGEDAARAWPRDFAGLWTGDGDASEGTLVTLGPLAWVELTKRRTPFSHPRFFWVGNAWQLLEGLQAFQQALQEARPSLSTWDPVVRAYCRFVGCERLDSREEVDDHGDPQWHVLPWSRETLALWEPPHFQEGVLRFCVEEQRNMARISVWQDTFAVEVDGGL